MGRVVDGPLAEVDGLLHSEVGAVKRIKDSIGVRGARPDGEEVIVEASCIIVYIVKLAVVDWWVGLGRGFVNVEAGETGAGKQKQRATESILTGQSRPIPSPWFPC